MPRAPRHATPSAYSIIKRLSETVVTLDRRSLWIVLEMATQLTTCHHPNHRRFSTVSADEPVDDSGAVCPVCGKVSTPDLHAYLSCMHSTPMQSGTDAAIDIRARGQSLRFSMIFLFLRRFSRGRAIRTSSRC